MSHHVTRPDFTTIFTVVIGRIKQLKMVVNQIQLPKLTLLVMAGKVATYNHMTVRHCTHRKCEPVANYQNSNHVILGVV